MMRVLSILATWFLLTTAALARTSDFSEPRSYHDLERMVMDKPGSIYQWGKTALQSIDPEKDPKRWILAVLACFYEAIGAREMPDAERIIAKARKLALEQGMIEEEIRLEQILIFNVRNDERLLEKFMEEAIAKAEKHGLVRLRIRLMSSLSYNLRHVDKIRKSGQLHQELSELIKNEKSLTPLDRIIIRNRMAIYLDSEGQYRQAESIYLDLIPELEPMGLRSLLASVHFNLGRLYGDQLDKQKAPKAALHFRKALDYAKAIDDKETMSAALIGLAQVSYTLDENKSGLSQSIEALRIAEELQLDHLILEALIIQARIQIELGLYTNSLENLKRAIILAKDVKSSRYEIEKDLARSYRGLEMWKEAYEHQEVAAGLAEVLAKERSGEEFAQQVARLGLDVETEKSKSLEKENALKQERLNSSQLWRSIMLGCLGFAVILIALLFQLISRERQRLIEKEKTARILDSLEEGVLLIDRSGLVEPGYSGFLTSLLALDRDISNQPLVEAIFIKLRIETEAKAMLASALQIVLGEDSLAWEFNQSLFPTELWTLEEPPRCLELSWQPRISKSQVVGLLLVIRDISERKILQESLHAEQMRSDHLYEKFQEWLKVERKFLPQVMDQLAQLRNWKRQDPTNFLRLVHTLKGVTRSIGLKTLSRGLHQLEDDIQKNQNFEVNMEHLLKDISDFECLAQDAGSLVKNREHTGWLVALEAIWLDVRHRLEEQALPIEGLFIEDAVAALPSDLQSIMDTCLLHGLNNAIDHGFIRPQAERCSLPAVRIEVSAKVAAGRLQLKIKDNGVGIDLQKIQKMAEAHGFQPAPGQMITDLLFEDGITTATKVSASSGRGLGLSAIRALCQEKGGGVQLLPNPSGGSILQVDLPWNGTTAISYMSHAS